MGVVFMPPKEKEYCNFISIVEALYKLGYKGVSLDGVHVGRCIQMELKQSLWEEGYTQMPVVEMKFALDKEGLDNLCDMHKFLDVMEE